MRAIATTQGFGAGFEILGRGRDLARMLEVRRWPALHRAGGRRALNVGLVALAGPLGSDSPGLRKTAR